MSGTAAVVIADIEGSTGLYERLGDDAARACVGTVLAALERAVATHGGRVVKSLGDGVLSVFPSPADGVAAALAMQATTDEHGQALRVAAHFGGVLEVDGDVYGDAVNTTARLVRAARPGETLVSRALFAVLPDPAMCRARALPPLAVPGKREAVDVLAATPLHAAAQVLGMSTFVRPGERSVPGRATFRAGGREHELEPHVSLSIGRHPDCGIRVDAASASRQHARVFHHAGKVYLEDLSANGTWVVPEDLPPVRLHRERAPLHGRGRIYLGQDPRVAESAAIEYLCE